MEYSLTRSRTYAPPPGLGPRSWIWRKGEAPTNFPVKISVPYSGFAQLLHVSSNKLIGHPRTPVQVPYLLMTGGLVVKGLEVWILRPCQAFGAFWGLTFTCDADLKLNPGTGESQTIQNVSKREAVSNIINANMGSKPSRHLESNRKTNVKTWNHPKENHLGMASNSFCF